VKKGLGKGLNSFFSDEPEISASSEGIQTVKITDIEPNKKQPRKNFDKEKISALATSISDHGLIQPIVVMKNKSGRFVIVAGERRWRAAKEAGLREVPVIINEYTDEEAAQIALIENLQRENLNPLEEALGYKSLIEEYDMTQEEVSQKIGKGRSSIANSLRLLTLEKEITEKIISGEITSGHARAILSLDDKEKRIALTNIIIEKNLNVRQAELAAKQLQKEKKPEKQKKTNSVYEIEMNSLSERLSSKFGTKVSFKPGAKKSKIEIEYYNDSDLERIIEMLGVE